MYTDSCFIDFIGDSFSLFHEFHIIIYNGSEEEKYLMDKIVYLKGKEDANMLSIFDVAKYLAQKEGMIDNTKIQKLCYYAQGWYLGLKEEPLFDDEYEAWVHGPVCRELYNEIRYNNSLGKGDICRLSKADKKYLDAIYEEYGGFSGMELSEMTHNETPWKITRGEKLWHEASGTIIDKKLMKDYFRKIVQKN